MPQQVVGGISPWLPINDVNAGDAPGTHARALTAGNQYYGPYEYNGEFYTLGEVGQPSYSYWSNWYIEMYKLTDVTVDSTVWTEVDAANHPTGHGVDAAAFKLGDVIYIAYKQVNSSTTGDINLVITSFDLTTELWDTTPITGGPNPGSGSTGTKMVVRPNGDFVILTNTSTSRNATDFPNEGVHYVIHDGSWGSPVLVSSNDPNYKSVQIQLDSVTANLVHFYYFNAGFTSNDYYHRSLSAANALGTEQLLYATPSTRALGVPTVYANKLYVPCADDTSTKYYPWVLIGASAGDANPTWSMEQISAIVEIMNPNNPDNGASFAILNADGNLVVFWVTKIPNTGLGIVNYLMYSIYNGTSWSTPVASVEDVATNADQDWWHNPSILLDSVGIFRIVIDRIHRTFDDNAWSVLGFLWLDLRPAPGPSEAGFPYTW